MPDLQLGFHGTFSLKQEDVMKILRAALEEQGLKDSRKGLMDRTGLGNEKVLRIKSWAIRSGLATDTSLSPEGRVVVERDPHLSSLVTAWLMHFHLSFGDQGLAPPPQHPADWGGWTWFIYSFLPSQLSFTAENLTHAARSAFPAETDASLKKNFRYVLRAYTESDALGQCQFLRAIAKDTYVAGEARLPSPYLMGYFLAKLWQRDFGEVTSIVTDDVLHHPLGLAPVLGIDAEALQAHLDKLEILGLLEQRRTVPPFQLVRRWDHPLELLEKAYADTE
jgi:hypothetical protein